VPWVLLDVLIGVLSLAVLAGVLLAGYRHVRALLRSGKQAGERIGAVMSDIDTLQRESASQRTP
jgi:riboflavin transporter FmnP